MTEIINKITSYNLFNYLFPGILFVIIASKWTIYDFQVENIVLGVFLYYFIGMTISRIGSLWIEKILKKSKVVKFSDYKDFVVCSKKDDKINLFLEINNTYRTLISLGFCLIIIKLYSELDRAIEIPEIYTTFILLIFTVYLYVLSYQKQTKYINKRIKANKD
ncbi:hypothetical protein SAMN05216480_10366 [Pustulibacterium marinum]|uniref:Uncharacterized protein n=1 Tax=Pustulibacterium marinum TaxID=1224947 RepID=A0A1I7G1L7_9FLAO|nr:hypothetical protein [Pustulibacterium marinum]SFU42358.1 hypothetical protein SAMN05216480_10366 [Pustulibacterium marinum]